MNGAVEVAAEAAEAAAAEEEAAGSEAGLADKGGTEADAARAADEDGAGNGAVPMSRAPTTAGPPAPAADAVSLPAAAVATAPLKLKAGGPPDGSVSFTTTLVVEEGRTFSVPKPAAGNVNDRAGGVVLLAATSSSSSSSSASVPDRRPHCCCFCRRPRCAGAGLLSEEEAPEGGVLSGRIDTAI